MIDDQDALTEIRNSWNGVRQLQSQIRANTSFAFARGGVTVGNLSSMAHNLPLLHACAVLNDTLQQLCNEGKFACRQRTLGALLHASKTELPWSDWDLIEEVKKDRNDLAHDGTLISVELCIQYINAIEEELVVFGVLQNG